MPRFSYGRRRRFGNMVRRARPIIRAATGITLAKRIVFTDETLNDVSAADFDNPTTLDLVECTETMDEEAISDGSTIADIPLYSRITAMRLNLFVTAGATTLVRWILFKKPDGENLFTGGLIDSNFHGSADTPTGREQRKVILAKGYLRISSDRLMNNIRVRPSRKAWARASPMREGDRLSLMFAKSAEGTTGTISGFGTLYVKANA